MFPCFFFFRKEHPYDVPEVISAKVTIFMKECYMQCGV